MPKARQFRNTFQAGHLDKQFLARSDAEQYREGCEILENFELLLGGGAKRRDGMAVVSGATPMGTRFLTWETNATDKFGLELDAVNGQIIYWAESTPATRNTLAWSNLTGEDVQDVDYANYFDTMILTHPIAGIVVLTKSTATTLAISAWAFDYDRQSGQIYQPYIKDAAQYGSVAMAPSGLSGSVQMKTYILTAGVWTDWDNFWSASHVGEMFKYKDVYFTVDSLDADPAVANVTFLGALDSESELFLWPPEDALEFAIGDTLTGATSAATAEVREIRTDADYWVYSLIIRPISGELKAPSFWLDGEAPAAQTEDVGNGTFTSRTNMLWKGSPFSGTGFASPSYDWFHPAWGNIWGGWPQTVAFHAGRLWFGGTGRWPAYLWASQAQDFYNFDVGQGFPNEAIAAPIATQEMARMVALVDGPNLEIFTDQAELHVPGYFGNPITPESFQVIPSSSHGCNGAKPVRMSYFTLFVDRSGKAIRRMFYDDAIRGYRTELVSGLSTSLVRNPVSMAIRRAHDGSGAETAWFTNSDGTVLQFQWWDSIGALACSLITRGDGGQWKDVRFLDSQLYGLVQIGSNYYIEKASALCLLDNHELLTNVTPLSVWAMPTRFATPGTIVDVCTDEEPGGTTEPDGRALTYVGRFTVDGSGNIDIGLQDYMRIYVGGVTPTATIKATPIDYDAMDGTTRGLPKKVISWVIPLLDTYHIQINGRNLDARAPVGAALWPTPLDNEDKRVWQLGYGIRRAPVLETSYPLPATVLAVVAEVEW